MGAKMGPVTPLPLSQKPQYLAHCETEHLHVSSGYQREYTPRKIFGIFLGVEGTLRTFLLSFLPLLAYTFFALLGIS